MLISLNAFLLVSGLLFAIGFLGLLWQRNALILLMCLELMLNAVNLALVSISRYHSTFDLSTGEGHLLMGGNLFVLFLLGNALVLVMSVLWRVLSSDQDGKCGISGTLKTHRDINLQVLIAIEAVLVICAACVYICKKIFRLLLPQPHPSCGSSYHRLSTLLQKSELSKSSVHVVNLNVLGFDSFCLS